MGWGLEGYGSFSFLFFCRLGDTVQSSGVYFFPFSLFSRCSFSSVMDGGEMSRVEWGEGCFCIDRVRVYDPMSGTSHGAIPSFGIRLLTRVFFFPYYYFILPGNRLGGGGKLYGIFHIQLFRFPLYIFLLLFFSVHSYVDFECLFSLI